MLASSSSSMQNGSAPSSTRPLATRPESDLERYYENNKAEGEREYLWPSDFSKCQDHFRLLIKRHINVFGILTPSIFLLNKLEQLCLGHDLKVAYVNRRVKVFCCSTHKQNEVAAPYTYVSEYEFKHVHGEQPPPLRYRCCLDGTVMTYEDRSFATWPMLVIFRSDGQPTYGTMNSDDLNDAIPDPTFLRWDGDLTPSPETRTSIKSSFVNAKKHQTVKTFTKHDMKTHFFQPHAVQSHVVQSSVPTSPTSLLTSPKSVGSWADEEVEADVHHASSDKKKQPPRRFSAVKPGEIGKARKQDEGREKKEKKNDKNGKKNGKDHPRELCRFANTKMGCVDVNHCPNYHPQKMCFKESKEEGSCELGEKCTFSHHPLIRVSDNFRVPLCPRFYSSVVKNMVNGDPTKLGVDNGYHRGCTLDRCNNFHPNTKNVCGFFWGTDAEGKAQSGKCKNGMRCHFFHDQDPPNHGKGDRSLDLQKEQPQHDNHEEEEEDEEEGDEEEDGSRD